MSPDEEPRDRDDRRDDALVRAALRAVRGAEDAGAPPESPAAGASCPDPESLAAFHERRLPAADARSLAEHAAGCARCAAALRFLAEPLPEGAPGGVPEPILARRRRLSLALAVAAVVILVLGARFLFVASGGGDWGTSHVLASSGVVIAARGGAAVAGRSEAIWPGESLAAGTRVALGARGELILATESGFVALASRGGVRSLGAGDSRALEAALAVHRLESTRASRLEGALALAPRSGATALAPLYPLDRVVERRPEFALTGPSLSTYVLRLERTGEGAGSLFRVGPVALPCRFPANEAALEPGATYRWTLESEDGRLASVSAFRVATIEEAERAQGAIAAAETAAGEADVLKPLVWIGLGFPAEGLRLGMAVAASSRVGTPFLHEMGIAARRLQVEPLAARYLGSN